MLKEKIQKDLNEALKSGDSQKRLVLGMVVTEFKNREIAKRTQLAKTISDIGELEKQSQLNDEETIEVLAREVKKRKEAIEQFVTGNRQDLAEREKTEIGIISDYLPQQLSEEEVEKIVKTTISELGAVTQKDFGKIVGLVMKRTKGQTDAATISRLIKKVLGND
jgi:uncharacterized protein YqeY